MLTFNFEPGNSGILSPGRWLWARGIIWALILFAMALLFFFSSIELSEWVNLPKGSEYVCAAILPIVGMVVYAALVRSVERRQVSELALGRAPVELAIGGALGFGFIAAVLALLWVLGLYQVQWGHWRHWYDFFLFNSYISGVLEELAFRAILLRLAARLIGPIGGLLFSALAFGLAHAGHAPLLAVLQITLNAGIVLGLLYMFSGRLWLSIGMHTGYDFTEWSIMGVGDKSGLLVISPVAGQSDLWTGGSFGPDGSVLTGVVTILTIVGILGVVMMRSAKRRRGKAH